MKFKSLIAGSFFLVTAHVSQAALIHEYDFSGSLVDKLGGPALLSLGGQVADTSYTFGVNQGLQLQEDLGAIYSIDMVFHFDESSYNQKIIDFNDLLNSDGLITQGTRYYMHGYPCCEAEGNFVGADTHLTITRDAKYFKLYENGQLIMNLTPNPKIGNFTGHFANFFEGTTGATDGKVAGPGAVDYIRIYNTALTAGEVAQLEPPMEATPVPPTSLPEPASLAILGAGLGMLGFLRRLQRH